MCQENEELRKIVEDWHTFGCESKKNGEDLVINIQKTVIDPLKQFQGAFAEMKNALKRKEQLQNDCLKYNQKVQKYSDKEKTSNNLVKLEAAKNSLGLAQEEYQVQQDVLARELPLFIESRIDYFQPSLAAFIRSETQYWGDNVQSFNDHNSTIAATNFTSADITRLQQQRLNSINTLSIVTNREISSKH